MKMANHSVKRVALPLLVALISSYGVSQATATSGVFPAVLVQNTTGVADSVYTGPPDDIHVGIGGQIVTYDFEDVSIVDGAGSDFNIYEVDFGGPEFGSMTVSVSADNITFFDVSGTEAPVVDLDNDNVHSNPGFARSYDISGTGLSDVRYVMIDGNGTGAAGGNNAFDLDAIGAVNFTIVPEPGVLGMLTLGGFALMRRRNAK